MLGIRDNDSSTAIEICDAPCVRNGRFDFEVHCRVARSLLTIRNALPEIVKVAVLVCKCIGIFSVELLNKNQSHAMFHLLSSTLTLPKEQSVRARTGEQDICKAAVGRERAPF